MHHSIAGDPTNPPENPDEFVAEFPFLNAERVIVYVTVSSIKIRIVSVPHHKKTCYQIIPGKPARNILFCIGQQTLNE